MRYRCVCALGVLSLLLTAGCSRSNSPLSPSPGASVGGGVAAVLSGTITALNGGQPLGNVSLNAAAGTVVTDASGAFELPINNPRTPIPVTISGPSIITRTTRLTMGAAAPTVFVQDGSFDLGFYRQLARNGFEQPAQLQAIRRLTQAPQVYLKTIDEAGKAIDAVTLDTTAGALNGSASAWSGGRFGLAGITRGTGTREGVSGWITVKWANPPAAGRCGFSQIGTDGGWIELNYLGPSCSCGGPSRIYPRVVRHELGHAFGFFHTDSPNDVMYGQTIRPDACDLQPSARERQYAAYVYSRPTGNTDPDNDPVP